MISRVAECCFWLERHVERLDNLSRLLRVHRSFTMETELDGDDRDRWYPLIIVEGEQKRFAEHFDAEARGDAELIQRYMTWDERCPVSILSSTRWARENARMIREVVSFEMWEGLNSFYHFLCGGPGKKLYRSDRDSFFLRCKQTADLFRGTSQSTMLHEEPYEFMQLGMLLERASQTARILDVKHHVFGPRRGRPETAAEIAQWSALLESCSATDLFLKHSKGALTGATVAGFLLLDGEFPRSVLHCLDRACSILLKIRSGKKRMGAASAKALRELLDHVRERSIDDILTGGVHAELTYVIDTTAAICEAIHSDYFDPPIPRRLPAAS